MNGIRFEILSIMQTMHAVGLMPDDIYQREKERLVRLISDERWESGPLVLEDWVKRMDSIFSPPVPDEFVSKEKGREKKEFDWKVIVADLLGSTYAESHDIDLKEMIKHEISHLGVQASTEGRSSASHFLTRLRLLSRWSGQHNEELFDARNEIDDLRREVRSLRREIRANRTQAAATGREVAGQTQPRPIGQSRASNSAEIEDLQQQVARCFSFAAQHEAKGEAYAAGQLRGQAARLESKLRDLGA